ncbi:MAG: phosphonoacetate hydrolase [Planctomycetota bacterium]|nr:MAG: phosphonoacetate hydrolase [Planctomycetota bacterium]
MLEVNDKFYEFPDDSVIGICMDGTSMDYYREAAAVMPNLQRFLKEGSSGEVSSVIPSYTNPNNMAIITGVPPNQNGINGNYYWDTKTGKEILMNDPELLQADSILSKFSCQGIKTGVVTAKDKLRKLLHKDLNGICFSIEKAAEATKETNGISQVEKLFSKKIPGIYDPDASIFCLEAGINLLDQYGCRIIYLTTTDYVQHKYAPGETEANAFFAKMDDILGRLDQRGVLIGITADHGMNSKTRADGTPKIEFLETVLKEKGMESVRVILPITDPYVVHHGALGSFAMIYIENSQHLLPSMEILRSLNGIEAVYTKDEACTKFQLPPDKTGDLVVLGDIHTVLGKTRDWHDLSAVQNGLRSHGGLHESRIPLIFNRRLTEKYEQRLQEGNSCNYHLFDFLFNGFKS